MRNELLFGTVLKLFSINAEYNPQRATVHVEGHYWLWNQDGHLQDLQYSTRGCRYEDLPTEYTVNSDAGYVEVPLHGQWNCTTRDITNKNRKNKFKDMCDLICDDGYGLRMKHLSDENGEPNANKWRIKSRRLVCKNGQWKPAAKAEEFPRCHNTCGELELQNQKQDNKAVLKCNNIGKINELECTPGVNCHHGATCYATCEENFEQPTTPRTTNEALCKCTQKKCGWDIPEDMDELGQCRWVLLSNNKRVVGGEEGKKHFENSNRSEKSGAPILHAQVSLGYPETYQVNVNPSYIGIPDGRKKRSPGEDLTAHRIAKREVRTIRWKHICGGIFLTSSWSATAAHCRTPNARLLCGEYDLTVKEGTEVMCRVRLQIRYPKYDGATMHDIMMVMHSCRGLRIGNAILPTRLPRPNSLMPVGNECTVCGWGTTSYPHYEAAVVLQCIDLKVMSNEECNKSYAGAIHRAVTCMGEIGVSGHDTCQGDSGGGAFCGDVCYGLVMGGLYCAHEDYPGVYTQVSLYVPWAVQVIRVYLARQNSRGRGRGGRGRRSAIMPHYLRHLE